MLPLGQSVALDIVFVPDGFELRGYCRMRRGWEFFAGNHLQRNVLEAVQARDDGTAKAEAGGVGEGDEYIERARRGLR